MSLTIDMPQKNAGAPDEESQRDFTVCPARPDPSGLLMTLACRLKQNNLQTAVATQEVLIVEDDQNNSDLLKALLKFNNVEASVATNATEAIAYCQTNTPQAILMDIGLPHVNGLELTHILRGMQGMEGVPVIAVTAHDNERMRDLADEVGCISFIAKPWKSEDILDALASTCSLV